MRRPSAFVLIPIAVVGLIIVVSNLRVGDGPHLGLDPEIVLKDRPAPAALVSSASGNSEEITPRRLSFSCEGRQVQITPPMNVETSEPFSFGLIVSPKRDEAIMQGAGSFAPGQSGRLVLASDSADVVSWDWSYSTNNQGRVMGSAQLNLETGSLVGSGEFVPLFTFWGNVKLSYRAECINQERYFED